jgi:hypothetical protein
VLHYDPATGIFRWQIGRSGVRAGSVAGGHGHKGYYQVRVDDTLYQAGRLACLYMNGRWPRLKIDYINRDRSDIRWANLREITHSQRAAKAHTHNKLGVKGVWMTKWGKYAARIKKNGKRSYLGSFDTLEKAGAAYANAAKRMFGEFASV